MYRCLGWQRALLRLFNMSWSSELVLFYLQTLIVIILLFFFFSNSTKLPLVLNNICYWLFSWAGCFEYINSGVVPCYICYIENFVDFLIHVVVGILSHTSTKDWKISVSFCESYLVPDTFYISIFLY